MNKNTAIKVKHLTKIYKLYDRPIDRLKESLHPLRKKYSKEFHALSDLSFEIKKGETVGIIGKNGSGKSTLLKILTGVITPTNGSIVVNGRVSAILELGAGFNPEMTGFENVYLNTSISGMSKAETDEKISEIVEFAELGEFIYQPMKTYSSGMKARLAFSVSINVDPDILIVDEALSVGDMNFQAKCMTAMDRIKQKGTTILFVSHDINSVKSLCNRGIYIENGKLKAIGNAGDVTEIYMTEQRKQFNSENKKINKSFYCSEEVQTLNTKTFKKSKEFDKKVAQFRHGTGEAKITYVELLDINNKQIIEAKFNQEVKIKIYIETYTSEKISVNFQLLDDKKINLVASSFALAGQDLLVVKNGDMLIVEYAFKLPLQHNTYSIQTMITNPIINDVNIVYIDVVPDSYIFKVEKRPASTLWSKIDLFPKLTITKL